MAVADVIGLAVDFAAPVHASISIPNAVSPFERRGNFHQRNNHRGCSFHAYSRTLACGPDVGMRQNTPEHIIMV